MADGSLRQNAAGRLAAFLEGLDPGGRRLTTQEIGKQCSSQRLFTEGWRITLTRDGINQQFHVLIDSRFPFSLPRIALPDAKSFLKIPHVESDGVLCLMTGSEGVALDGVPGVARYLLDKAIDLVQQANQGSLQADFIEELESYWIQAATSDTRFWNLVSAEPASRAIAFWEGKKYVLLAENKEDGARWLANFNNSQENEFSLRKTVLLWLSQPLYPESFPFSNLDLLRLAEIEGDEPAKLIRSLATNGNTRTPVLIGTDTPNGVALMGVMVKQPDGWKRGIPIINGYRPGKVPLDKVEQDFFAASVKLERTKVVRVNKSWLHMRTLGHAANTLSSKKVALIGCGALGGQLALMLAQAGVGSLVLCDYGSFEWENVGRHVLSGKSAGVGKVYALKAYLHERFPELAIELIGTHWEEAYSEGKTDWKSCDVIVSTTGDWASEASLNRLARTENEFPPVVFGWTEAYACASHALAIMERGGCLACGMDAYGRFVSAACSWGEDDSMERREPACGAFYQPYGIVELAPAHSMIAGMVIDILEGRVKTSEHRVWLGNAANLSRLGGKWSEVTQDKYNAETGAERLVTNNWRVNRDCPLCN